MTQSPDLQSQSFEDLRVELVHLGVLLIQNRNESDRCMAELNALKKRESDIIDQRTEARVKFGVLIHAEALESLENQVTITNGNELL